MRAFACLVNTSVVDVRMALTHRPHIEVVAHRGASEYAPENTFASTQIALSWGVDYVELDVSRSKDDVLYVFHGPHVDRTTDCKEKNTYLCDLLSSQIDLLDAGSWFNKRFSKQVVPRLTDYLTWIKGKAKVYLDVKDASPKQIIDVLQQTNMHQDAFVWHRDDTWVLELRKLAPDVRIKINAKTVEDVMHAHDRFQANIIEVRTQDLQPSLVATCQVLGMKLMVFEPEKSVEAYKRIWESGANMANVHHADCWLETVSKL